MFSVHRSFLPLDMPINKKAVTMDRDSFFPLQILKLLPFPFAGHPNQVAQKRPLLRAAFKTCQRIFILCFIFCAGLLPDPIQEGPRQEGVMLTVQEPKPTDPAQAHRPE